MLSKSLARLSSGQKIVNPSDDAAGLAVASRLDAQIQRTNAAKTNVSNAVSFTQTQDGYLKKIGKALDRMSELTLLAQDVTKSDADRESLQQ
jgi:flagellin